MKRVAISGSRRTVNEEVERDVRSVVSAIIKNGDGIVSWWALGVDFIAVDEALTLDPTWDSIKIFLPTTLNIYDTHMHKRAEEWVITREQADAIIEQLRWLDYKNSFSIVESVQETECNERTYFQRNTKIIEAADEVVAFHVNKTQWTQDAIDKALKLGKKVQEYEYTIPLK